jgi:hypothetical protein
MIQDFDPNKIVILNRYASEFPKTFTDLCDENGISFIDLNIPLNKLKESGIDPNYWPITKKRGHWNHDGHLIVGKEVADQIDKLWLE